LFDTLAFRFFALLATPVVEGVVSVPSADSSRSPSFDTLAFRFFELLATPVVEGVLLDTLNKLDTACKKIRNLPFVRKLIMKYGLMNRWTHI
jgi:hypothetical protein